MNNKEQKKILLEDEEQKIVYKFFFTLMKPAKLRQRNKEGKEVIWNVARHSAVKSVIAYDMPVALQKIRKIRAKKENKGGWIGFQLLDVKEVKTE